MRRILARAGEDVLGEDRLEYLGSSIRSVA
jgi:hypothetical protein